MVDSEKVRLMKRRSSRRIQEEFPQLGKRCWDIGYAAFGSGHVTDEMVREYLKHHKNHLNHRDDDFLVE
jgi:putative transposase